MSLDGFSMIPLCRELKDNLLGGRIDRIFQPNKTTIIINIRQPGKNHCLFISVNPNNPTINLTEAEFNNPETPPNFCMFLRKHIEDGRISEIFQTATDRVINLAVDVIGKGGLIETKVLVIELMGKYSNIILLQDNIILDALKKIGSTMSRIRLVLPNKEYFLPQDPDKLNILTTDNNIIKKLLKDSKQTPYKFLLQTFIGFGPITAKEIIFRSRISDNITIQDLTLTQLTQLEQNIIEFKTLISNNLENPTLIINEHNKLLAIAAFNLQHLASFTTQSFSSISKAIDYSAKLIGEYIAPEKETLKKIVTNEINKLSNKLIVLEKELALAQDAESVKKYGDLLLTIPNSNETPFQEFILINDWFSEDPYNNEISIKINPLQTYLENANAYYNKYNKLKRAQELLVVQLTTTNSELTYLKTIEASLEHAEALSELREIKDELILGNYLKEQRKFKPKQKAANPLKVITPDNTEIFIGKNNFQNDYLTFKLAQPNDLWLHVKDIPGSHIIIRSKNHISDETLEIAAQLAVHFSKAKNSSKVPVDYTFKKNVKKPNGTKPGFVNYTNEKALIIDPNFSLIEKLVQ